MPHHFYVNLILLDVGKYLKYILLQPTRGLFVLFHISRILNKPFHNNTLEKNYDHTFTIFDARTMFVQSLHLRDVNMLVIRDFLCNSHNIL